MTAVEGDALARLLRGAGVDASGLRALPALPDGEVAWVLPSRSPGWFDDWLALRDLVEGTGRWPVAATGWGDLLNRSTVDPRDGTDRSPAGVLGRVPDLDVDALLDAEEADALPLSLEEWYEFDIEPTLRRHGHAPTLEEMRAALGDEAGELAIERWVLDWEEERGGTPAEEDGEAGYLAWYEPQTDVQIVLLPRAEPWAAPAYIGSYAAAFCAPDLHPALFRRWHEQFGAEPAANWDTMQQLVVRRPPTTLAEAWEVARAMRLLWPDTTMLSGVAVREHARDLVGRDRWFLHLRP